MSSWNVSFEAAWTLAMRSKRVREWLFDTSPVRLSTCLAVCNEQPVLSGYSFTPACVLPPRYPVPNVGQIICVVHQDAELILGAVFSIDNKNMLFPAARLISKNYLFDYDDIAVHRVAFFVHPMAPHIFLRLDFLWMSSGLLNLSYTLHPVSASITSCINTPAVMHVHLRFFYPDAANALRRAALFPTDEFIDDTNSLLNPCEGFVVLDLHDTRHQTACGFCISRNLPNCECPVLFRRRRQLVTVPSSQKLLKNLPTISWKRFAKSIQSNITTGALTVNWRLVQPQKSGNAIETVVASRLYSYCFFHTTGVPAHRVIQRLFSDCGLALGKPQQALAAELSPTVSDIDSSTGAQLSTNEAFLDLTKHPAAYIESTSFDSSVCANLPFQLRNKDFVSHSNNHVNPVNISSNSRFLRPIPSIRKRPRAPNPLIGNSYIATTPQSHRVSMSHLNTPTTSTPTSESSNPIKHQKESSSPIKHQKESSSPIKHQTDSPKTANPAHSIETIHSNREQSTDPQISDNTSKDAPSPPPAPFNEREAPNLWRCRECGKLIRGKRGNLNRHRASRHDKLRPFQCTYATCQKLFQTRLNMVRHVRSVHEGRPEQCPKCPRAFKTETELDTHLNVAHKAHEPPMACHDCGCCFGRRSTLNRHITRVHGKKSSGNNGSPPIAVAL